MSSSLPPWAAEFNLGEFLGIGLDTAQIGYLAGSLFLVLFSLSALRHAGQAQGLVPAIWIAIAIGLFGGAVLVAARGFPEQVPEAARPWTTPDRLIRAGAVLALAGCALVLISAHWVRGAMSRWLHRVTGLALGGVAVWLAAGWFAEEIPAEVRVWTADRVIARAVLVLAVVFLGVAFWVRQSWGSPHARWLNRAVTPPALAFAAGLGWRWFGAEFAPEISATDVARVAAVLAVVATGTCLLIAGGAYLVRERPARTSERKPASVPAPPKPATKGPLPVAVLLDETGRPILPASIAPRSGPAGA
jgi:hypothetical protein